MAEWHGRRPSKGGIRNEPILNPSEVRKCYFPANLTLEPSHARERERIDMLGRYWFVARVARDSHPPKLRGIAKPLS